MKMEKGTCSEIFLTNKRFRRYIYTQFLFSALRTQSPLFTRFQPLRSKLENIPFLFCITRYLIKDIKKSVKAQIIRVYHVTCNKRLLKKSQAKVTVTYRIIQRHRQVMFVNVPAIPVKNQLIQVSKYPLYIVWQLCH